ncbi:hypothetical protein Q1695_007928 [Nippostrongylus brasiliensis]|nr:hypothetical protein Q1695_007928 [Nippostrongylus brasiliensis]
MVDKGPKAKNKPAKNRKVVNRQIRTTLSNINKNLLSTNSKEKLKKFSSTSKDGKSSSVRQRATVNEKKRIKSRTNSLSLTKPKSLTLPVQAVKSESPLQAKPISSDSEAVPRSLVTALSKSTVDAAPKVAKKPKVENATTAANTARHDVDHTQRIGAESSLDLSPTSLSDSRRMKATTSRQEQPKEKPIKNTKPYNVKQLKHKVAKLLKKTQTLRAEDPAVDKLIAEAKESLAAVEALLKLYNELYHEAKGRTRRLMEDFEQLKTITHLNYRELEAQIAHQLRSEIDTRKELEETLKDSNFRSLPKPNLSRQRREDIRQPSYLASALRSVFGL